MRWLVVLFLGLAGLAQTSEARACSCINLSPSEGRSSSHAIFTGEVIEIGPNQATGFGGLEITLRVERVWKGELTEEVKVHTAGSGAACGYTFVKGETYLVYALRDAADPMRVSLCSRTALAKNAKEDLAFLGEPSHQFDGGKKGGCAAAPGSTDGTGLGLFALLLIGAVFVVRRRPQILAVGVLAASLLGCNTTPNKPSLMANMAKENVTVYELRARDYEYASQFAQLVAACVVDITATTDDPSIRDHAFQWRMWAMPQARAAAFDQDPFAGLIELWVLSAQQHQYFDEGGGAATLGGRENCALNTTKHLVEEAELIASNVMSGNEFERIQKAVADWVDAHPIEGKLFVRPSARADLASLVPAAQHGGLKAMGSMEETLRDMGDRMTILTVQTPMEVRWQAEYLVQALFEERVHDRIDSMVDSMGEMTGFLDTFEGTLSAQTAALLAGIEKERITVFDAVEGERDAIVATIGEERDAILSELDSQLATTAAKLDTVGRGLIDHFFLRLIEVLVVMGVAGFLTVLLVLFVLRKRGAKAIDPNPPTE
jgi:MYXO-CTERM domain-containing protein